MATKAPAKTAAKGGKKKTFKKKEKKMVPVGVVHVQASFNNTIITITDPMGNVLSWSSSGSLGFRGSRKGTPFAAQQASLTAANKAKESGLRSVNVNVSGPGAGRASAVRALSTAGLAVRSMRDHTPVPRCQPLVWKFVPSGIVRRSRTMDAGRLKTAASDFLFVSRTKAHFAVNC